MLPSSIPCLEISLPEPLFCFSLYYLLSRPIVSWNCFFFLLLFWGVATVSWIPLFPFGFILLSHMLILEFIFQEVFKKGCLRDESSEKLHVQKCCYSIHSFGLQFSRIQNSRLKIIFLQNLENYCFRFLASCITVGKFSIDRSRRQT